MSAAHIETKGSSYDYCPAAHHTIFQYERKWYLYNQHIHKYIWLQSFKWILGLKWAIVFSLWEPICASVLEDKTLEEINNACYSRDHILLICSLFFFSPPALLLQCGFFDRARPPKDDDVSDREQLTAEKSTDAWEQIRWHIWIQRPWDDESPWRESRSCGRRFQYLCKSLQIQACK